MVLDLCSLFSSFYIRLNHILNLGAVDAKERYPKEYTTWREDPANFYVNGVYSIRKLWTTAREASREILLSPVRFSLSLRLFYYSQVSTQYSYGMNIFLIFQGENFLVVTHKSILWALICTAVRLPPERYVMVLNLCTQEIIFGDPCKIKSDCLLSFLIIWIWKVWRYDKWHENFMSCASYSMVNPY